MRIIFIRHGKTKGNLEQRYIGKTNEPLCEAGRKEISLKKFPDADAVISSPMRRCVETAEIIYPKKNIIVIEELRECDFGDFEGKNYSELETDPNYQKWLESFGKLPFPNGESSESFKARCINGFEKAVLKFRSSKTLCFVVHGGTIMSVLEHYAFPKKDFYSYQVKNGCGFETELQNGKLTVTEELI